MKLLANENFPRSTVEGLRDCGFDVVWVRTEMPGVSDKEVLARAVSDSRVLVTFDKDFGELAYHAGLPASCGVILFRFVFQSPSRIAERVVSILSSRTDWVGQFAVIDEFRIRIRSLPQ